jgi:hypothetical protein
MQRPKNTREATFGVNAEWTAKAGKIDNQACDLIHKIGKNQTPPGHVYVGSVWTHFYKSDSPVIHNTTFAYGHGHAWIPGNEPSSAFVAAGIVDLANTIKQRAYGIKPQGTLDQKDKRGDLRGLKS